MTEILSAKEILEEGKAIITEYNLDPVPFTKQDAKLLWTDFLTDPDEEITHMIVRENIDVLRNRYNLRMLTWIRDFYWRYSELESIYGSFPKDIDYGMFFTICGRMDIIKVKNTTFYSCLMYLLELELSKLRRVESKPVKGKVRIDFGVLTIRQRVRAYMKEHPDEVFEVEEKYKEELEG